MIAKWPFALRLGPFGTPQSSPLLALTSYVNATRERFRYVDAGDDGTPLVASSSSAHTTLTGSLSRQHFGNWIPCTAGISETPELPNTHRGRFCSDREFRVCFPLFRGADGHRPRGNQPSRPRAETKPERIHTRISMKSATTVYRYLLPKGHSPPARHCVSVASPAGCPSGEPRRKGWYVRCRAWQTAQLPSGLFSFRSSEFSWRAGKSVAKCSL